MLQQIDARSGALQDYQNDAYFSLIRNFRRHSWLLLYLFGASPAVCATFVAGRTHRLQQLKSGTLYLPDGTSLRMGPLGYQSDAQASLAVSYNSLESYARSLNGALTKPYPPYAAIGIGDGDNYRQLGTSLLQIENEFYGTIRPKRAISFRRTAVVCAGRTRRRIYRSALHGPRPVLPDRHRRRHDALSRRIPAALPAAAKVPPTRRRKSPRSRRNQHHAAGRGRDPGLRLARRTEELTPAEWGAELLAECEPIAAALDHAHRGTAYRDAVSAAGALLADPAATPSARILRRWRRHYDNSYVAFALAQSTRHRDFLLELPLAPETDARFARMAADSLATQRQIEAADSMPFEDLPPPISGAGSAERHPPRVVEPSR